MRGSVPRRGTGTESPGGARKVLEWGGSEGVRGSGCMRGAPGAGRQRREKAHPVCRSTREGWEADTRVQAKQGAAGGEGPASAEVERALTHTLDTRWTRRSSGSDGPPPVRRVAIPQGEGRTRPLGMPTGAERIAQRGVQRSLEPAGDPPVHPESEGDRPGQSALAAVGQARERWGRADGVRALARPGCCDPSDHARMRRAVRPHTDGPWVRWSSDRGLKAPVQRPDGTLGKREQGTPQGGAAARCARTSAGMTRALGGGGGSSRTSRASGTPLRRGATVSGRTRRSGSARSWSSGVPRVEGRCSRSRRRWSPARRRSDAGTLRTSHALAWAIRVGPGGRRSGGGRTASLAVRRPVPRPPATVGASGGAGSCTRAGTHRGRPSPGWSILDSGGGSPTTAVATRRPSLRHSRTGIGECSEGRGGSTRAAGGTRAARPRGCDGVPVASRTCSRTGGSGRRRLDAKSRMRRAVHVRFREGAGVRVPPRYSTGGAA